MSQISNPFFIDIAAKNRALFDADPTPFLLPENNKNSKICLVCYYEKTLDKFAKTRNICKICQNANERNKSSKKIYKKITPEIGAKIIFDYTNNISNVSELSKKYNFIHQTIRNYLKNNNVYIKSYIKKKLTDDIFSQIVIDYTENKITNISKLSKKYSFSRQIITYFLEKEGYKKRK